MVKRNGVFIALTAAAVVLTGCGGEEKEPESSAATSSTSAAMSEVPAAAAPVSKLVPNLTLPPGAVEDDPNEAPEIEIWQGSTSSGASLRHLEPQLPIGQPYDGLAWCSTDRNFKLGSTLWSWGGAGQETLLISVDKDGEVTIHRYLDETDDRADCDVPVPGGAPRSSALAGIPLPAGSTAVDPLRPDPTMEQWTLPGTHQEVVQYLNGQLAVGGGHDSLLWCSEDGNADYVDWVWGDEEDLLEVHVLGNRVTITRGPNDYGCI